MIEIVKDLIEKPENIRLYILYLLNVILSIIITSNLYVYLYGDFDPILIGDEKFWSDLYHFFISGKVLIVAAIFFFIKYVILELVSAITLLLLSICPKLFASKTDSVEDASFFRFIFKFLGILKFSKVKGEIPSPSRNFHIAKDVVKSVNKNDLHDAALEIRNTSIFELFNLYFVFSLVYFLILVDFHNSIINTAIIIGFFGLIFFLISIEYVFHIILSNYDHFSKSLSYIDQVHVTEEFMKRNGLNLQYKEGLVKNLSYINEVKINDDAYYICHYFGGKRFFKWLKQLEEENANSKVLLITNEKISKGLLTHINNDFVKIIRYKNEKKFIKKLEAYFFRNKNIK